MAYVTGTANSISDLLTSIRNACTANGWTLSGDVLHKGTCYVETKIVGTVIQIRGGRGVDGSNNLTDVSNQPVGQLGVTVPDYPFAVPYTYFVHVNTSPDEVYAVVNYSTINYQTIAWGKSPMQGLLGGGNWYCGPGANVSNEIFYRLSGIDSGGENGTGLYSSIFCRTNYKSYGVDHSLDATTWAVEGAQRDWASLFFRQPNQWNGESILIPIRVYAPRPSGFISPVLECAHARYVSIVNLSDEQIIMLGTDKWKIYPFTGRPRPYGRYAGISGCWGGHAIRYDGP